MTILVAVAAPLMARYGWDRDELYFLCATHHLALGYADFPPLVAVAGWFINHLAPGSLVAIRIASLTAGAATVVMVALIARELPRGCLTTRRIATVHADLRELQQIRSALGGTLNDVVLSAMTGALRELLVARGEDLPRHGLRAISAPLIDIIPIVPLAAEHQLGIAAISYAGRMTFGLYADRAKMPNLDVLKDAIATSLQELAGLAHAAAR